MRRPCPTRRTSTLELRAQGNSRHITDRITKQTHAVALEQLVAMYLQGKTGSSCILARRIHKSVVKVIGTVRRVHRTRGCRLYTSRLDILLLYTLKPIQEDTKAQ